jgi:hypothetical protein
MTDFDPNEGHASKPLDTPEHCPACGGTLVDVPFEGDNCPHCGYDLKARPEGFGQAQQEARNEQQRRQGGPVR